MNIILLGPPGAGKGTQARILVDRENMVQLSTGDMLRDARKSDSAVGRRVSEVMDRGELVTDQIVIDLIEEQLTRNKNATGFIFDGFPRTLGQADALDALLSKLGQKLEAVIEMRTDDAILIKRISGRFTCAVCGEGYHDHFKKPMVENICDKCGSSEFKRRPDDNAESVKTRLMEYYKKTSPLIGYYYAKSQLHSVDGLAPIETVESNIRSILEDA